MSSSRWWQNLLFDHTNKQPVFSFEDTLFIVSSTFFICIFCSVLTIWFLFAKVASLFENARFLSLLIGMAPVIFYGWLTCVFVCFSGFVCFALAERHSIAEQRQIIAFISKWIQANCVCTLYTQCSTSKFDRVLLYREEILQVNLEYFAWCCGSHWEYK